MDKPRTCFLHVPKSGGSSVISILRSTFGAANVIHANESRYQHAPLEFLLEQYPVVAGHFTFAQISDVLLETTYLFTFLREPVDRALSHYYYYREQAPRADHDQRVGFAQRLDLEAFITSLPDRPNPWSNWQTFLFSGASDCEQAAEELLPAALRNLERMDFVGVHEEFDEGLRRLGELRGWPSQSKAPRVNVTVARACRDEIDPVLLERLFHLNTCDAQLLARARELWQQAKTRSAWSTRPSPSSGDLTSVRPMTAERGTKEIVFTNVSLRTEPAREDGEVGDNDRVFINLQAHSHVTAPDLTVGIRITDALGLEVYGVNTRMLGMDIAVHQGQTFDFTFAFDMILAPGRYQLTVAIHSSDDHLHRCYHWIDNALAFECRRLSGRSFSGLVDLKATATQLSRRSSIT